MKLKYLDIKIVLENGILSQTTEHSVEEYDVIGENGEYYALNDYKFTTIQKKPNKIVNIYPVINKPSICVYNKDSVWGTSITYRLYYTKKKRTNTIRREIEDKVEDMFGHFAKVDLSSLESIKL